MHRFNNIPIGLGARRRAGMYTTCQGCLYPPTIVYDLATDLPIRCQSAR